MWGVVPASEGTKGERPTFENAVQKVDMLNTVTNIHSRLRTNKYSREVSLSVY